MEADDETCGALACPKNTTRSAFNLKKLRLGCYHQPVPVTVSLRSKSAANTHRYTRFLAHRANSQAWQHMREHVPVNVNSTHLCQANSCRMYCVMPLQRSVMSKGQGRYEVVVSVSEVSGTRCPGWCLVKQMCIGCCTCGQPSSGPGLAVPASLASARSKRIPSAEIMPVRASQRHNYMAPDSCSNPCHADAISPATQNPNNLTPAQEPLAKSTCACQATIMLRQAQTAGRSWYPCTGMGMQHGIPAQAAACPVPHLSTAAFPCSL